MFQFSSNMARIHALNKTFQELYGHSKQDPKNFTTLRKLDKLIHPAFSFPKTPHRYPIENENLELQPHPNSDLVIPFLKLFNWSLLVPDSIEYDHDRRCFFNRNGNLLKKVLSYIWLMLMTVYLTLVFAHDVEEPMTIRVAITKVTWASYTLFDATVIKCLRMNGSKIATLLTQGSKISNICEDISNYYAAANIRTKVGKRRNLIKHAIWGICGLGLIYTFAFTGIVISELTATTTNLFKIFSDITNGNKKINGSTACHSNQVFCDLLRRPTENPFAVFMLTFWFFMASSVELIWVTFLMMAAAWGFYFKNLLSKCINIVETYQIEIPEGIHIYTRITTLLEDFNKIFGSTILWIVIASVLYKAATLGEFLAGYHNGISYDAVNIVGFLPFVVMMYTASETHRMGYILPSVIKKQFLNLGMQERYQTLEVLHGISVIQYDALSNNVGFKGLGFFTISYTFVASLIGVIITYSLVTLQFKIGEIPLN